VVVDVPATQNFGLAKNGRFIPQMEKLLFAAYGNDIQVSDKKWNLTFPGNMQSQNPNGTITLVQNIGQTWYENRNALANKYDLLQARDGVAIPCNGITMIAVYRPLSAGLDNNWQPVIDILRDAARLNVAVNSRTFGMTVNNTYTGGYGVNGPVLQEGARYVLTVVVQPTGESKMYTNGVEVASSNNKTDMTLLRPGLSTKVVNNWDSWITIGRNYNDGWATCNGDVGAAFTWKVALSDSERQQIEQDLLAKYRDGTFLVKALVAGEGLIPGAGSVSPASAVVSSGGSVNYTITRDRSKQIKSIRVNGALIPNMEGAASYTVENVTQDTTVEFLFKDSPAGLKIMIY
jgi:hypothetical protein